MSMNYDDSSSLIFINTIESPDGVQKEFKISKLQNPNRIYFDIENAVLIGDKQQLVFEKSSIKEIRLSQFTTEPDVVRAVVTFDEGFDVSGIVCIECGLSQQGAMEESARCLRCDHFGYGIFKGGRKTKW